MSPCVKFSFCPHRIEGAGPNLLTEGTEIGSIQQVQWIMIFGSDFYRRPGFVRMELLSIFSLSIPMQWFLMDI